jgi:hypothetical protein
MDKRRNWSDISFSRAETLYFITYPKLLELKEMRLVSNREALIYPTLHYFEYLVTWFFKLMTTESKLIQ